MYKNKSYKTCSLDCADVEFMILCIVFTFKINKKCGFKVDGRTFSQYNAKKRWKDSITIGRNIVKAFHHLNTKRGLNNSYSPNCIYTRQCE